VRVYRTKYWGGHGWAGLPIMLGMRMDIKGDFINEGLWKSAQFPEFETWSPTN